MLWLGDGISQLGSQLSALALPVLAVRELHANELQMGLLGASGTLAFLLVGLPAGAWVDRWRKRPVLVAADLLRALALAVLPLVLWLGGAAMLQLYAVALVTGVCTVFFDVAWQSCLPLLLDGPRLVPANARLQATESVAQVAGPAIGGQLLRLLGAPLVVLLDAASFLGSALFVARIRHAEPARAVPDEPTTIRSDIAEGMRFVLGQPLLLRITACTALSNLGGSMAWGIFVLYALRDLHLSQGMLGLVFGLGSLGGLLGAFVAAPLARIVGEGRLIPLAILPSIPAMALTPLAPHLPIPIPITLAVGSAVMAFAGVAYNVTHISFRQRLCPPRLLARMNASIRFLVFGTIPLGSVLGGVAAARIGIPATLWIATAVAGVGVLPVLVSPFIRMREIPTDHASGV
jgi:MFS family permease